MEACTTSNVLHPNISKAPSCIVGSQGNYLKTKDGYQIFDASGGAAVVSIGHNDSRVKDAINEQLSKVAYCYAPFFTTEANEDISRRLTESTGGQMSKVYVVSSGKPSYWITQHTLTLIKGTEAVEAALKMARQYFTELPEPQLNRTRFIARRQSYHGNTLGSLATGYHSARRAIYEQMLSQNVSHVSPCYPYRDLRPGESNKEYVSRLADELEAEFQRLGPNTVCAFVAETVCGAVRECLASRYIG